MRSHPHLYEIAVWPWLERLSRAAGRRVTLATVPDSEWDRLKTLGFDLVYLMGVWRRSPLGRHIARTETSLFDAYDRALPDWSLSDVVGSPYCVADYSPDPRVGTWRDLDRARRKLRRRGMGLVLDFVPNHTAFDHQWVSTHTHRYLIASRERFRAAPRDFRLIEPAGSEPVYVACARDPYFPPWTDVAQLNYFEPDTHAAMIDQLRSIATHCDGVRCDMAMLVLRDVFVRTWEAFVPEGSAGYGELQRRQEFWSEVRDAVPDLLLIAETYWDLEPRLQELGFSFTYDKRFYERLAHESPSSVRDHLRGAPDFQARCVRFLENHDEPRSYATFGAARIEAAATLCATAPGLRFYYDGQLEGRTRFAPVQLGRWADETPVAELKAFYERLLQVVKDRVFHDGDWSLLDVADAGDSTYLQLVALRWRLPDDLRIVVVNPGWTDAQGYIPLAGELPDGGPQVGIEDQIQNVVYERDRAGIMERGLFVRLEPGRAHLFRVATTG